MSTSILTSTATGPTFATLDAGAIGAESEGAAAAAIVTHNAVANPHTAYLTAVKATNVPAVSTGGLVLLSDVITALGALQASHNSLLAKLKTAGVMVPD